MGEKLCASLPITHSRSIPLLSTTPHNHPYFSPSVIYPRYLRSFGSLEIRYKLWLPIYLFQTFFFFSWLESTQQIDLIIPSLIHHVLCIFWIGVLIDFFGFRSTHLHPLLQVMLLSNGSTGVSGFRQWSFSPLPPTGCWRVSSMRQRALRLNQCVELTSTSSAFLSLQPPVDPDVSGASRY